MEPTDWIDSYLGRIERAPTLVDEHHAALALYHLIQFKRLKAGDAVSLAVAKRCAALCQDHTFQAPDARMVLCQLLMELQPCPLLDDPTPTPPPPLQTVFADCRAALSNETRRRAFDAAYCANQRLHPDGQPNDHLVAAVRSVHDRDVRSIWNRFQLKCIQRRWNDVDVAPDTVASLSVEPMPLAVRTAWAALYAQGFVPWVKRPTFRLCGLLPHGQAVHGLLVGRGKGRLRLQVSNVVVNVPLLWTFASPPV